MWLRFRRSVSASNKFTDSTSQNEPSLFEHCTISRRPTPRRVQRDQVWRTTTPPQHTSNPEGFLLILAQRYHTAPATGTCHLGPEGPGFPRCPYELVEHR